MGFRAAIQSCLSFLGSSWVIFFGGGDELVLFARRHQMGLIRPCELCGMREAVDLVWIAENRVPLRVCRRWVCRWKVLLLQMAAVRWHR